MKRVTFLAVATVLVMGVVPGPVLARQAQDPRPYAVGNPLGLPVYPAADGAFEAISSNVKVYVADRDGGTTANEPSVAVIRRFDMQTGAPAGAIRVEGSPWINDIEVTDDGTIYATQTGDLSDNPDPAPWQVWRIAPDGTAFSRARPGHLALRRRLRPGR